MGKTLKSIRIAIILFVMNALLITSCELFKTNYDVNFNTNGGSAINSIRVQPGELVEEPEDPIKEGVSFIGWYLDDEIFDFSKPIHNDITLLAKYESVTSEINFEEFYNMVYLDNHSIYYYVDFNFLNVNNHNESNSKIVTIDNVKYSSYVGQTSYNSDNIEFEYYSFKSPTKCYRFNKQNTNDNESTILDELQIFEDELCSCNIDFFNQYNYKYFRKRVGANIYDYRDEESIINNISFNIFSTDDYNITTTDLYLDLDNLKFVLYAELSDGTNTGKYESYYLFNDLNVTSFELPYDEIRQYMSDNLNSYNSVIKDDTSGVIIDNFMNLLSTSKNEIYNEGYLYPILDFYFNNIYMLDFASRKVELYYYLNFIYDKRNFPYDDVYDQLVLRIINAQNANDITPIELDIFDLYELIEQKYYYINDVKITIDNHCLTVSEKKVTSLQNLYQEFVITVLDCTTIGGILTAYNNIGKEIEKIVHQD